MFTGDSVTQGAAHTFGERDYVQIFEERLRWDLGRRRDHVIRTAVSGRTVADLADDLHWSVLQYRPDIVSVMLGLNDSMSGVTAAEFSAAYGEVLQTVTDSGALVVLHTPNRVRPADSCDYPTLPAVAEKVRALAHRYGTVLADHHRAWERAEAGGKTAAWLGETCHPNAFGHRAMARLLLKRLGMWDPASATAALTFPHARELDLGDD
ncbi:MAG: SGNH/GDSL hydrolase family protein [Propionibacteriaceae bacterium]|nr:SGNH/GDSL hydrolase family protein [Propionibacteriaceae bacterium]